MVRLVRSSYPTPRHDCARTTAELGRPPTSLIEGLGLTIRVAQAKRKALTEWISSTSA
jgi:hypothetical protein